MADNIVYELSLHDMFTQTMEKANQATEKMEGHLEKVNDLAKELVLSLGAGLAIFKGFEILKEGLGEFKKITIESAVLTNELKNQGKYSKQLVDNLKEGREQLENLGFFKEGDNFKFQQQLMKQFPGANDKYRELYTETAANLANGGSLAEGQSKLDRLIAPRLNMKTGDIKENYRGLFKEMGLQNFEKFLPAIQEAYQQGHDTRAELTEIINKIPGVKDNAKTRADNDTELQTKKAIEQFTVDIGKLGISLEKEFLPEIIDVIHSLDKFVNEDMEGIKTSIKVIGDVLLTIAEFMVVKKVAEGILGFIGAVNSIWKGLEKLVGIETAETIEKEKSTAALELLAAAATEAAERLALINPGIGGAATSTAATVGEEEVAGSIVLNGSKIGSMSMVAAALVVTMSVTKSIIDGIKDYGTRGTGHLGGDTFKYLAKDDRIRKIEELNANMPNNIKMNALNSAINKEYPNQMTQLLKTVGSRTDLIPELFKTSKEDSESSHFYEAGTDRGADQYGYYLGKQIKKLTDEIKTKDGKAHTGDKSSKGTASGTNVRGVQPKNTYITINDGLIKSFAPVLNGLNTNEDKLEALSDKMVSLIKNSMIQAINDSENISNSGS